jgi:hypothetical protein
MTDVYLPIIQADDFHAKRWMMFVDGENLTMRAQRFAKEKDMVLTAGPNYSPDVFIWMPDSNPRALGEVYRHVIRMETRAIRCHYYTSVWGDDAKILKVRDDLHNLRFYPGVFKKSRRDEAAKGVDIALTKDMLSHAFLNNYDVAILVTGDGDYVPVVHEVQRQGKFVLGAFLDVKEWNEELRLAVDSNLVLDGMFLRSWGKSEPDGTKDEESS